MTAFRRSCLLYLTCYAIGELLSLQAAKSHLEGAKRFISDLSRRHPAMARFCQSALDRLSKSDSGHHDNEDLGQSTSLRFDVQNFINLVLVTAQEISSSSVEIAKNPIVEDDDGHVKRVIAELSDLSRALRPDKVLRELNTLSEHIQWLTEAQIVPILREVLPFVKSYLSFFDHFLAQQVYWTKAVVKLAYVSGTIVNRIARDGFCKPPETNETAHGGDEGALEATDGTGLGQGTGDQNVSEQIEDSAQYEGVQGQESEEEDEKRPDGTGDDALDVDFDLSGALEDGPEEDGENGSGDDDGAESVDDEFGNDDNQIDEVDENFWNAPLEDKESPSDTMDQASTSKDQNSETVAKESGKSHTKDTDSNTPTEEAQGEAEDEPVDDDSHDSEETSTEKPILDDAQGGLRDQDNSGNDTDHETNSDSGSAHDMDLAEDFTAGAEDMDAEEDQDRQHVDDGLGSEDKPHFDTEDQDETPVETDSTEPEPMDDVRNSATNADVQPGVESSADASLSTAGASTQLEQSSSLRDPAEIPDPDKNSGVNHEPVTEM